MNLSVFSSSMCILLGKWSPWSRYSCPERPTEAESKEVGEGTEQQHPGKCNLESWKSTAMLKWQ